MDPKVSLNKERDGEDVVQLEGVARPAAVTDIRQIAPLVERIVARLAPEEIWLFGSRAEGYARPDSDYDLLAVLPDDAPELALDLMKAWELTCGLGIPADLVPCTRSDFEADKHEAGTLARAAFHRGQRIYDGRAFAHPRNSR